MSIVGVHACGRVWCRVQAPNAPNTGPRQGVQRGERKQGLGFGCKLGIRRSDCACHAVAYIQQACAAMSSIFVLTFCTSVVVGHCCGQTIFSKHLQGDSWTWLSEQKIGDDIVTAQRPGWRMGGHTHTQHAHTDIHALNTHTQTYVTAQRPGWRMGGPGLHWPPISPQPFGEFARRSAL